MQVLKAQAAIEESAVNAVQFLAQAADTTEQTSQFCRPPPLKRPRPSPVLVASDSLPSVVRSPEVCVSQYCE